MYSVFYKSYVVGKYLADVFYLPASDDLNDIAGNGNYLNQELIFKGLAERYWRW